MYIYFELDTKKTFFEDVLINLVKNLGNKQQYGSKQPMSTFSNLSVLGLIRQFGVIKLPQIGQIAPMTK